VSTSFPLDSLRVRFAGDTHVGMTRAHNEDALHLPVDERLAIVADGMGGHASGEVASRMAVETVVEYFRETAEEQVLTWPFKVDRQGGADVMRLVTAIKLANVKIHEQAQRDPACKGMGTTIVSALFRDDGIIVGHVGDSRVYRVREGVIAQLTEDHSLINDYIKMKRMTAEEAVTWPHKNVIVRALGMKESVQVDVHTEQPRLGDCYVLCSDGLSGMISDEVIRDVVLEEKDLDRAAERLITSANDAGGKDNVTVVLARIETP
jgi:serine/threonine protein phosphatase PrpC